MFGIGAPELIIIFVFIGPVVALILFVSKAERQMKKESDSIIRVVDQVIKELRAEREQTGKRPE